MKTFVDSSRKGQMRKYGDIAILTPCFQCTLLNPVRYLRFVSNYSGSIYFIKSFVLRLHASISGAISKFVAIIPFLYICANSRTLLCNHHPEIPVKHLGLARSKVSNGSCNKFRKNWWSR